MNSDGMSRGEELAKLNERARKLALRRL